MYSPYAVNDIKRLCDEHRIRPTKDRGQNFLVDEAVARTIVRAAGLKHNSSVIEVGPGLGSLTFLLAETVKEVIALEIDAKLVSILKQELHERDLHAVTVIESDALLWLAHRSAPSVRRIVQSDIVANLPYAITSDFFSCVLRDVCVPRSLTVMVQKEVADRLAAVPPHLSMLSVVAQWYGAVKVVQRVPRSAFWPQPAVESALVRIDVADARVQTRRHGIIGDYFFSWVRRAFLHPRKKIGNTIGRGERRFDSTMLDKRPSELTVDDWRILFSLKQEYDKVKP